MTDFQDIARRVIAVEQDGLRQLADGLDESFDRAVETLLNATGRIIISGMGKSGHIARKIAATLASTGTPAHFVHPAEASHGDLGMMAQGDVAMVLSNSGETPELADMVAYTRRFNIPLIGVASRPDSTLLKQSDVALVLPKAQEACGTGIVPTTSTTMTLALGDALAVALMEHRSFTPENFREFHPGGKLGAQLSKVRDLMHRDLPLVASGTSMGDALLVMSQKSFGVVGVTDAAGALLGIVTDGDLRRHMENLLELDVDQVMTDNPRTIGPDAMAEEAVALMTLQTPQITCLFIVDPEGSGQAEGILHIHDCLRAGLG
ncbi:KpsF/GutQ family sugar-phosphate isomerase [Falsiruegeria mediterranea]|uniref:Arabinose 5-phosphate isomerase KdsD n=1 Tax=Falsiruegeria mediterranea M17 TaxID=1200281 RepID=A0A2R8C3T2_9RHOB|nr:KpsF/GutQ family sugar-phosphate isomerase [Falsiruegeria mediterranea]SPJ27101.1 Arabinose 5-phosphate isomerase KdsD [Falsiruegeria mediterranea M17]